MYGQTSCNVSDYSNQMQINCYKKKVGLSFDNPVEHFACFPMLLQMHRDYFSILTLQPTFCYKTFLQWQISILRIFFITTVKQHTPSNRKSLKLFRSNWSTVCFNCPSSCYEEQQVRIFVAQNTWEPVSVWCNRISMFVSFFLFRSNFDSPLLIFWIKKKTHLIALHSCCFDDSPFHFFHGERDWFLIRVIKTWCVSGGRSREEESSKGRALLSSIESSFSLILSHQHDHQNHDHDDEQTRRERENERKQKTMRSSSHDHDDFSIQETSSSVSFLVDWLRKWVFLFSSWVWCPNHIQAFCFVFSGVSFSFSSSLLLWWDTNCSC